MRKAFRIITLSVSVLLLVLSLLLLAGILWVKTSKDYVSLDNDKLVNLNNSLTIVGINDEVIDEPFYVNFSKRVSLDSIPEHVKNAFVCIEDKRFYTHNGIDIVRIGGATLKNVSSMSLKEGASTITQQLVKNTHLSNAKTLKRKANEIILAINLEKQYDKDEILEMYLNTIYFGGNCYGIESAANTYFNKSSDELTLEEGALLAGIIKAPNTYSPTVNKQKCLSRRNLVLDIMQENGYISADECSTAKEVELTNSLNTAGNLSYAYTFAAIKSACSILNITPMQLINSGYTIKTYYDENCQQALQAAVDADNGAYDKMAIIADNCTCGIKACYVKGDGNMLYTPKQVGSTLKPIAVYAPAIEEKLITTATPVLDESVSFADYTPRNYNDSYCGWTTITNAVKNSLNVPAVKTLNSLTLAKSEKYMSRMGLPFDNEDLSLALGNYSQGITVSELCACYSTLVNGGKYSPLHYVESIKKGDTVLYQRQYEATRVFSVDTSFLTTAMLKETVESGTAKKLANVGFEVAAKTGTVGTKTGNSEAILCGYTSKDSFVFWCADETAKSNGLTGGNQPATIAKSFLQNYYSVKPRNFTIPENVIQLNVDSNELYQNQLLVQSDEGAKNTEAFYFAKSNTPNRKSTKADISNYPLLLTYSADCVEIRVNNYAKLPHGYETAVYKVSDGKESLLSYAEKCVDYDVAGGNTCVYRLALIKDGIVIGTSCDYEIQLPQNDSETENEEINDFEQRILNIWY